MNFSDSGCFDLVTPSSQHEATEEKESAGNYAVTFSFFDPEISLAFTHTHTDTHTYTHTHTHTPQFCLQLIGLNQSHGLG